MRNGNKVYPGKLKAEVENALSDYPDLADVEIEFRWGVFTQHSFMLAQPKVITLLRHKSKREYLIIMRKKIFLKNKRVPNGRIPSEVLVGWLGHELGHIVDYIDRSSLNLAWFGILYYFSKPFLRKAEITADYNAVKHGLVKELLVSKEFGRNPMFFPWKYINKLNTLYPSIETVLSWNEKMKT
ncbi:MAG: hypothetical protein ACI8SE_001580 [Bacteroidia bacterium]|jgi:hypothetical protein